jgi:alcohol dehydrogenase class IV
VGAEGLSFEFATAARIVFGAGRLREAGAVAASLGAHALVVESGSGRSASLIALLHEHGVATTTFHARGEPTITLVRKARASRAMRRATS